MDTLRLSGNVNNIDELRREAKDLQKNGLPYMMSSVIVWGLVLGAQILATSFQNANLLTFISSAFMMPIAILFSLVLKAKIFKKTKNPVSKLGFLCTMNQNLYLPIAMLACTFLPQAMLLMYAIIFGAHLLPFAWVYNCKAYTVISIIEAVGAMFASVLFGNIGIAAFIIIMQIILVLLLFINARKEKILN